jgi:H+/gluconate symporter-like permease
MNYADDMAATSAYQIIIMLVATGLLIFLAYRGVSVLVLAPLLAMGLALASLETPALRALSEEYMPTAANYLAIYFPVFLTGALFGHLMGASGSAERIAGEIVTRFGGRGALAAVVIATGVLTYGGVSLFVVVFAMYPIAVKVFRAAGIPKRLMPAAIASGAFTFTMTALPGSPQALNAMPTVYFNTTIYAAPFYGLLAGAIMLGVSLWWLDRRGKAAAEAGEGYGEHEDGGRESSSEPDLPPLWMALLPIVLIFLGNLVLARLVFASPGFIARVDGQVNGTWPVIVSIALASVAMLIGMRRYLPRPLELIRAGAQSSLVPAFNTASVVGFGGVIRALTAFGAVTAGIAALSLPALVKVGISTTLIAGIVGSASGGTAIALELLAEEFLATGVAPELLHRVLIMSSGVLDSLPHSGGIITLLAITRMTHRESYADIAMVTIAAPLAATAAVVTLHALIG